MNEISLINGGHYDTIHFTLVYEFLADISVPFCTIRYRYRNGGIYGTVQYGA